MSIWLVVAISHLSPLSLISSSLIHSLRCYSSPSFDTIPNFRCHAPSAPRQHLRDAYSSFDTHMMRSSLAQEISAFAVAVSRRSSLPSFPFISPFNYPEGWRRQRRGERPEAKREKAGTGKARGQKIAAHVTAVSSLVIRKQNQSEHDVDRWKVLSQQEILLGRNPNYVLVLLA